SLRSCFVFLPVIFVASSCSSAPFFFSSYGDYRDLHSFPTRRSSDLIRALPLSIMLLWHSFATLDRDCLDAAALDGLSPARVIERSEEHTSELQSPYGSRMPSSA